ncbi:MAG: Vi polysaccharide biosynthesis UDP-N-acetylglucosamine C-6 dehydrogenase TviB [Burkholderiales bacterium]
MEKVAIGIVGLGYVGLPLAIEFGKKFDTIGYDVRRERIEALREGRDDTLETSETELRSAANLRYTDDLEGIRSCNVYIVTVPTPVGRAQRPDLSPLRNASKALGSILKRGDLVIYESTVYPGTTEEFCVPILESVSGLVFNRDFHCGYSPERINPGDPERKVSMIKKVTSGSTPEAARMVDELYRSIIKAGTHPASSIRVAEAAKVIENVQRDVNIALINELAQIFNKLEIDTSEVLEAAGTKWNFLPFRPGLVGGHCIGVDPYYLTHKAQVVGYHPELMLVARRINDSMGDYVARQVIRTMHQHGIHVVGSRILVMGITFKENCPDLRNTRVVDIVREFQQSRATVDVYDPWADAREAKQELGLTLVDEPGVGSYDAIVVAVAHREFREMGAERIRGLCRTPGVIYDVKHILATDAVDARL